MDGVNYHFSTKEEMKKDIDAGKFIEWAEVYVRVKHSVFISVSVCASSLCMCLPLPLTLCLSLSLSLSLSP